MKIMKRFVKINSFLLGSLLLLLGCYDDKGSYNYHDINEINIELPATVNVRLSKEEAVPVNRNYPRHWKRKNLI